MNSSATTIDRRVEAGLTAGSPLVCWFEECGKDSVPLVGGKCASLGELINAGVQVPPGFALTTEGYRRFMAEGGIDRELKSLLGSLDCQDLEALERVSATIRATDRGAFLLHRNGGPGGRALSQAVGALRHAGGAGGRALQRHGRGSPGRELRRPAGHLSVDPRHRRRAAAHASLHFQPVHRPSHRLPRQPRLCRRVAWRSASACRRWPIPIPPG